MRQLAGEGQGSGEALGSGAGAWVLENSIEELAGIKETLLYLLLLGTVISPGPGLWSGQG